MKIDEVEKEATEVVWPRPAPTPYVRPQGQTIIKCVDCGHFPFLAEYLDEHKRCSGCQYKYKRELQELQATFGGFEEKFERCMTCNREFLNLDVTKVCLQCRAIAKIDDKSQKFYCRQCGKVNAKVPGALCFVCNPKPIVTIYRPGPDGTTEVITRDGRMGACEEC